MVAPFPFEQGGVAKAVLLNLMLHVDDQANPLGPLLAGLPHKTREAPLEVGRPLFPPENVRAEQVQLPEDEAPSF